MSNNFCIIIPARYGSTRLPGKPLLLINDKTLIQHVYETAYATHANKILIATDSDEVMEAAASFGAKAVLTSSKHESGTDRIGEVIEKLNFDDEKIDPVNDPGDLSNYPPPEKWDDWVEFEPTKWSQKKERHYTIVPTSCFNCEAGCGLLSYVDKETGEVRKFEGNPYHPASRGRNCAKGPATINQIKDPDRILHPMRRIGKRGAGKWERVSWDVVLDEDRKSTRLNSSHW